MSSDPSPQTVRARRARRSIVALAAVVAMTGCGGDGDGLIKHPVSGTVLVDGLPAEGVRVRLYRIGEGGVPAGSANADTPVGVTDEAGRFVLSTNGLNDGAVAGRYRATFTWPDFNGPGATDRLGGRYADAAASGHEIAVESGENVLRPVSLDWPARPPSSKNRTGPPRRDADDRPL